MLKLNYPIEKGLINNWDDYEKILEHFLTKELKIAPEEHNIMLTESPNNTKKNKPLRIAFRFTEKLQR